MEDCSMKTWFRAFSQKHGGYFTEAYGPDCRLPKVTRNIRELAAYIAYYWWRCGAQLETSNDGISWKNADEQMQKDFTKMLDDEFFKYEGDVL